MAVLRSGLSFHSGDVLDSAAVAAAFEDIRVNGVLNVFFAPVESIEAPDESTVVLNMSHPYYDVINVVDTGYTMGAEDFSHFAREVPAMYFFVGSTARGTDAATAPSNHSPEFFLDEEALKIGTRAMLAVALEYLCAE